MPPGRRRRRRPVYAGSGGQFVSVANRGRGTRARRGLPSGPGLPGAWLGALLVVIAAAVVIYLLVHHHSDNQAKRRAVAVRFAGAWGHGDYAGMYRLVDNATRRRYTPTRFRRLYRSVIREAGVTTVRVGRASKLNGDHVSVPVAAATKDFGTLRGIVRLPVTGPPNDTRVRWTGALRLPGLRAGESVRVRHGTSPERASVLAADDTKLDATANGASIAGVPASGDKKATGLERIYDDQLAGHGSEALRFGSRTIARAPSVRPKSVHTTIRPGLSAVADKALNGRLGGVAVLRPSDGAVLALSGIAVSAPQPPGSTFKIITLSAALEHGVAKPSSTYPVRTSTQLAGVTLRNANNESCGGTLSNAFAVSCNSVFAPLGAKLGAKRLVGAAEDFGFNEQPRIPAAKPSVIPQPSQLKDAIALGSSAIGQDRDLATPLEMASVGAAIGEKGRRPKPYLVRGQGVQRRRAVSAKTAATVRGMMLGVVRGGTGTAAAIPGVQVAGKTGTAELRSTVGGPEDPKNTDAWFVAFAPASKPKAAVAVLLVGAGAGGAAAAPVARQVLQAALQGG